MGALTNSWYSHSPLVITAGQQVRPMIGVRCHAGQRRCYATAQAVGGGYEPANAQDVPRALSQAISSVNTTPKAPVYLSIPLTMTGISLRDPASST